MVKIKKPKLFRRVICSLMAIAIVTSNFAGTAFAEGLQTKVAVTDVADVSADITVPLETDVVQMTDSTTDITDISSMTEEEITELTSYSAEQGTELIESDSGTSESDESNSNTEGQTDELTEQEQLELLEEEAPPVNVDADKSVIDSSDYILANINPEYAKADKLEEYDILLVKQTMAIGSLLPDDDKTLNALWFGDNGAYQRAFVNQAAVHVYLYNTDDNSDYYVAYANTQFTDESMELAECAFAYNNLNGEVVNDCIYDYKTGLAYIPKKYTEENKNGVGFGNIQVQFLQLVDSYDPETEVNVIVDDDRIKGSVAPTGTATADANSLLTTIQLAGDEKALKNIDPDYVKVFVNDVETSEFAYDAENGVVIVNYSPLSIHTLKIDVTKPNTSNSAFSWIVDNLFGGVTADAAGTKYAEDGSDWTVAASMKVKTKPVKDDVFKLTAMSSITNGYNGSGNGNTYIGEETIKTSAAPDWSVTDTWDISVMISKILPGRQVISVGSAANSDSASVEDGGVIDDVDYNSIIDMYQKVTNALNNKATFAKNVTVSSNKGNTYTLLNQSTFYYACAHIQEDYGKTSLSNKQVYCRVLYVSKSTVNSDGSESGYMIVGMATCKVGGQNGTGAFKIEWKTPPKNGGIKIKKQFAKNTSSAIDPNDYKSSYSLGGAIFGVYKYGTNNSAGTMTTDTDGVAEIQNLPAGKYTIKELSASLGCSIPKNSDGTVKTWTVTVTPNKTSEVLIDNETSKKITAIDEPWTEDTVHLCFKKRPNDSSNPVYYSRPDYYDLSNAKFRLELVEWKGNDASVAPDNIKILNGGVSNSTSSKNCILAENLELGKVYTVTYNENTGKYGLSKGVRVSIVPDDEIYIMEIPESLVNPNMGGRFHFRLIETVAPTGYAMADFPDCVTDGYFDTINNQLKASYVKWWDFNGDGVVESYSGSSDDGAVDEYRSIDENELYGSIYFDKVSMYPAIADRNSDYYSLKDAEFMLRETTGTGLTAIIKSGHMYRYSSFAGYIVENTQSYAKPKRDGLFGVAELPLGEYELVELSSSLGHDVTDKVIKIRIMSSASIDTQGRNDVVGDTRNDVVGDTRNTTVCYSSDGGKTWTGWTQYMSSNGNLRVRYSVDYSKYSINDNTTWADDSTWSRWDWVSTDDSMTWNSESKTPHGTSYLYPTGSELQQNIPVHPISFDIVEPQLKGSILIQKKSSDPCIPDNNMNYSLSGAVYGIYFGDTVITMNPSTGKPEANAEPVVKITTDEDGIAKTPDNYLALGKYLVVELVAPKGYKLSNKIYEAEVKDGDLVVELNREVGHVEEEPVYDPISALLVKKDSETANGQAQGNATLEGAEFTISFYDDTAISKADIEADLKSGGSKRTMKMAFKTVTTNGHTRLLLNKDYLVEGSFWHVNSKYTIDDFYNVDLGAVNFPMGTVVIQETKAPNGYKINNELFIRRLLLESDENGEPVIIQYEEDGKTKAGLISIGQEASDATVLVEEEALYAGLIVQKIDEQRRTSDPQGDAEIWADYIVYNKSNGTIKLKDSDTNKAPSAEIMDYQLSNDNRVVVASDDILPNGVVAKVRATRNENGKINYILPYGSYSVEEYACSPDYNMKGYLASFNADADSVYYMLTDANANANPVKRGSIKFEKFTADFGTAEPQGDATLEGAEFTIYNKSAEPVWIPDGDGFKEVPVDGEVGVFRSNENGLVATPENYLPIGTYSIKETKASDGYLLNDKYEATFKITNSELNIDMTGKGAGSPYNCSEPSPKGSVKVSKVDADTYEAYGQGNAELWAEYTIYNRSANKVKIDGTIYAPGDVIVVLKTNTEVNNGVVSFDGLPYGTYEIKETDCSPDYKNAGFDKTFTIRTDGQVADYTGANANSNPVKTGKISVQKFTNELEQAVPQGDATLEGAEFTIWNKSEREVVVHDEDGTERTIPKDALVTVIKTDKMGFASTPDEYLPIGKYEIRETKAPEGYLLNTTWVKEANITNTKLEAIYDDVVYTKENDVSDENACGDDTIKGKVKIAKYDADKHKSEAQGDAELWAEYKIINKSANGVKIGDKVYAIDEEIAVIKADEKVNGGIAEFNNLPYGTYRIYEYACSPDYKNAGFDETFTIRTDGQTVDYTGTNANENPVKKGGVMVQKFTKNFTDTTPSGDSTFEGAEFTIYNKSAKAVIVDGKTIEKDEAICVITAGADGIASTSEEYLPIGTYSIKETKAPEGYTLNTKWNKTFIITADPNSESGSFKEYKILTETVENDPDDSYAVPESPIRGGVQLQKNDAELQRSESLNGGDRLEGIDFEIINRSKNPVEISGVIYNPGEVVKTITSHWNEALQTYTAETGKSVLPYGTYEIKEVVDANGKANAYYLGSDKVYTFKIRERNKLITVDNSDEQIVIEDNLIRRDIFFTKSAEDTLERMNTLWVISNITDESVPEDKRERHVIATNENGEYNSSSGIIAHSKDTNANDSLLERIDKGEMIPMADTVQAGVWFGIGEFGTPAPVNDALGALPCGKYHIQEVRTDSNKGYTLMGFDFVVNDETPAVDLSKNLDINLGDLVDTKIELKTVALDDKTGDHFGYADEDITIEDTVEYTNLTVGEEYTLKGILVNKDTGEYILDADGNTVTSEVTFSPKERDGSVVVTFNFNGKLLAGTSVVVFEDLYYNGYVLATHADVEDENQTIKYPKIKTLAKADSTDDHDSPAKDNIVIVDTISYENLTVGKEYVINGTLMDVATNDEVVDANGKEVKATKKFTPETESGEVTVEFKFNASKLAGHTVVVFESFEYNGERIALHADIKDTDQTIYFPEIGTVASDARTYDNYGVTSNKVTLIDTVNYDNLIVGKEYILTGKLMNKETNEVLKDADGKEITSSVKFTPTETSGKVQVAFDFDSTIVEGQSVVAFEYLERKNIELATHTDINDKEQTVNYPKVRTKALYGDTKMQEGLAKKDAVIKDTVMYENLKVGEKYSIDGTLMNQSTGNAVIDANGKPITVSTDFVPKKANGEITVEFKFDATDYAGQTFVVFERLSRTIESEGDDPLLGTAISEVVVAKHEDINDKGQTINFPEIGTTLTDKATGLHETLAGENVVLVDTVEYKNLTVGKEYTLTGKLMDKATGKVIKDTNGKEITASKKFKPDKTDGVVEIEFKFNGLSLAGKTTVAFEDCTRDGISVAVHADIDDENQTVRFPKIITTAIDNETNDHYGVRSENAVIVDTVKYENLTVGKQYTLVGQLMDKAANTPVVNTDGKPVTSEVQFIPEAPNGSVEVKFEFNSLVFENHEVVVFETLKGDDITFAVHTDIKDTDQTVGYSNIKTKALYGDTEMQEGLAKTDAVIKDTVMYENFKPGEEYTIEGKLMSKDTNSFVTDANGNEIVVETKFTPEEPNGEITVEFKFDATDYAGQTFVVFEKAYRVISADKTVEDLAPAIKRVQVASHEDIEDAGQTINFPEIGTTLTDKATGSHEIIANEDVVLVDTVEYKNLTVGKTYVMNGSLMNKETGEPMIDADGNAIKASVEFTPETPDGVVEVEFKFNGVNLAGETAVAFEDCTRDGISVAVHADIDDENQIVRFPAMKTLLHKYEGTEEDKSVYLNDKIVLTDEVMYENLTVGNYYVVSGVLMNKDTQKPVLDKDGNAITAESRFAATEADGTVELVFTFDGTVTDARTVVAFDELYTLGSAIGEPISMAKPDEDADDNTEATDATEATEPESTDATDATEASTKSPNANARALRANDFDDSNTALGEPPLPTESTSNDTALGEPPLPTLPTDASEETTESVTTESVDATESEAEDNEFKTQKILVAEGKDWEDENETMTVIPPEIGTVALGDKTGTHMLDLGEAVTIIDTVNYKNLNPGTAYSITGKLMDKETGRELLGKDGKVITSKVDFIPDSPDGSVEVKFEVDSTLLIGKTIVVFEDAYIDEIKVATHADIEDENQTVHVLEIGTVATGKDGRSKTIDVNKAAVIKDTVSFKNLVVGEEYIITGVVMNRETGKPVGDPVQVKFTPDKPNGAVDVTFTIDTTSLSKATLVCFETVSDAKGNTLGEHKDINDNDQSVVVKTTTTVQTGITTYAGLAAVIALSAMFIFMLAIGGTVLYRKRKLAKIKRDNY